MPIQYQTAQLPPDYQRHINDLLARAQAVGNERYVPYGKQRVASLPLESNMAAQLAARIGKYAPSLNAYESRLTSLNRNSFPDFANQYMNPYENHVIRGMENEADRTFREKILPALEGRFVRLGQHGGTQHKRMAQQAARDLQSLLAERRHQSLAQGYNESRQQFNTDQARQLLLARELSGIGQMRQAGNLADVAALQEVGSTRHKHEQAKRDTDYQEYLRALGIPAERLSLWSNVVQGAPHASSGNIYENPLAAPPQMNTVGNLGSIVNSVMGMGRTR